MVKDIQKLKQIRDSWMVVRQDQAILECHHTLSDVSMRDLWDLPIKSEAYDFRQVPESLLLLFAVSVIEDTLGQLSNEGVFQAPRPKRAGLTALMDASRAVIPWRDFAQVVKMRERRHQVAHRRQFLRTGECAPYLDALAQELLAWGVLERDAKIIKIEIKIVDAPSSSAATSAQD